MKNQGTKTSIGVMRAISVPYWQHNFYRPKLLRFKRNGLGGSFSFHAFAMHIGAKLSATNKSFVYAMSLQEVNNNDSLQLPFIYSL